MILHTEVLGDGEPIVFLHTGLQTGLIDFEAQREFYKSEMKVLLPDLRGHGKSKSDQLTNFIEDSVEDLKETFDHLGLEKFHLVGCSLGGMVALAYAKKYDVKSLTISGIFADKPENWNDLHKADVAHQQALLEKPEAVEYFNQLHESDWKQFLEMAKDVDWYPFDMTEDISDVKAPVLFIVGEGNINEVETAWKYKKMNESIHVCILPFAAHLVHSEQPDLYTQILSGFLEKVSEVSKGLVR